MFSYQLLSTFLHNLPNLSLVHEMQGELRSDFAFLLKSESSGAVTLNRTMALRLDVDSVLVIWGEHFDNVLILLPKTVALDRTTDTINTIKEPSRLNTHELEIPWF